MKSCLRWSYPSNNKGARVELYSLLRSNILRIILVLCYHVTTCQLRVVAFFGLRRSYKRVIQHVMYAILVNTNHTTATVTVAVVLQFGSVQHLVPRLRQMLETIVRTTTVVMSELHTYAC